MARRIHGVGQMASVAVAVALGAAVGCGDGFASADCHESHTCEAAAGEGGAADGNGAETGAGHGGTDTTPLGGAGGADSLAGGGGAGGECKVDLDCSNDIPEDGAELCDAGVCSPGNPPPTITSFSPESDEVDVEPDTSIVIEFNEPLDPKTVNETTIQLLDGTTVVKGKVTYAAKKVTFSPDEPLALQASYKLLVKALVTDDGGAPLVADQSSTFQVRDGTWTSKVIVNDVIEMSDVLPMMPDGKALLAWTGKGVDRCPATARWFLRGQTEGMAKTFPVEGQNDCEQISAGANADGVAAIVWTSPSPDQGVTVQHYSAGAWLPKPTLVSTNTGSRPLALTVAPSGATTVFEHDASIGSVAWTTDPDGKWPATSTPLSSQSASGPTRTAFDAAGRGWAVWRAEDQSSHYESIVATRLAAAGGTWATATALPGSVAERPKEGSIPSQRGVPVVALDGQGDALALWVDSNADGRLMASRFVQSAWSQPELISGTLMVDVSEDAPALVFDGHEFIAAWSAQQDGERFAYTARYDLATGWNPYQKQQTAATDATSALKMPRLVSDGRGNLLLVYATGTGSSFTLMYQRYTDGAWGSVAPVPEGTLSSASFQTRDALVLSMSDNGLAALAWTDRDSQQYVKAIHLASFF